ncbi:MAG: GTPase activating protein [Cyphobasidiales sp. Tagirdzhanova-0007]|nr:MAG: GTPase activating protein [Cyphobasidiales sp. Tagirdzhanova-0007]
MGGGPRTPPCDVEDDEVTTLSSESDPEVVQVELAKRNASPQSGVAATSALVYAKSKVYLHPTSYSRDNVPGWVSLVKRGTGDYLLSWIPESLLKHQEKEKFVKVEVEGDGVTTSEEVDLTESVRLSTSTSAGSQQAAWSVPLTAIYSIMVTPPTLANWYGKLEIHLSESYLQPLAAASFGNGNHNKPRSPLFFHDDESPSTMFMMDRRSAALASHSFTPHSSGRLSSSWGGENLIYAMKKYSNVVKSSLVPSLYLINPSQGDLEAHSVPLFEDELPSAAAVLQHRQQSSTGQSGSGGRTSILHQSLSPHASSSNTDALPALDNLTFNVLNSFSRLTNRAKSTAQNIAQPILSHPLSKPILKHLPPPIASLATANAPEYSSWAEKAGVAGYDAARVYLARWARIVAEEGEKARRSEMSFTGNEFDTAAGRDGGDELSGPFEVLATTYRLPRPRSTRVQGSQPIVESEWNAWFDTEGKLMLSEEEAKRRIFQRGLASGARKIAWPFLLNVYPWDASRQERETIYAEKQKKYQELKGAWFGKKEVTSGEQFIEEHHRIHIDCLRTDRAQPMFASDAGTLTGSEEGKSLADLHSAQLAASTIDTALRGGGSGQPASNYHTQKMVEILLTYNVWETDLGYVQGMSDLCSPLYIALEGNESLVFWSFVNLMEERMKPNFYRDQSGIKHQLSILQELIALMDPQLHRHLEQTDALNLFFCFRWILIAFKREFKFEDCLCVWESLWSAPTKQFHLFLAMSILEDHRNVIIRYLQEFDEVLKYVNELSQTLEPQHLLSQAEVLYMGFKPLVEATDRRSAERASLPQAQGSTTEGLRQRFGKEKDKDPLVQLVKDEVQAEASVPDLEISKDLRGLLQ